ncbi:hypothetical protein [Candidatus Halobonum tyrrellensis]|uniref:Uncharacterized protein n=1 Tax=Candidatus Halobonum tyrrellensis G22 TaxID=1324957 RepID=V4GR51_9EURY|nr:hypothetical protein [Candidatus Halobonum tyrrellensis]ESP87531.1 hypothetical protein K933_13701 [Candidatus Halobonum tyrrellensis G22]
MDRRLRLVVVVLVAVALVAVGAFGVAVYGFLRPNPDSYAHTYEYRAYVQPTATLSNVTLYLPLPVENGTSPAGDALAGGSAAVTDAPPDWEFAVENTTYGPMLALRFDELEPNYDTRPPPRPLTPGEGTATPGLGPASGTGTRTPVTTLDYYLVGVRWASDDPVDTRDPAGSEPVLSPRLNATTVECGELEAPGATCRRFGTRYFLSYDAPANATADLLVTYEGRNEWFAGGWTGNSFEESAGVAVRGGGPGWVAATGNETVGVGAYRGAPDPAVVAGGADAVGGTDAAHGASAAREAAVDGPGS